MQPIVWVALGVGGVFVGLGVAAVQRPSAARTYGSAALIAAMTTAAVAAGLHLLVGASGLPLPGHPLAGTVFVALCASASAALQAAPGATPEMTRASHLADLDDVPLLLAGVAVVAALAAGSPALRLVVTVAAGGAIGLAGGLLFERAAPLERGVFLVGGLLLIAGSGAYLGTSPLLSGFAAALVWARVPVAAAGRIRPPDLRILQHPLVGLLLIVAGASIEWTRPVLWVTAYIVVLRFAAKLLVSVASARLVGVPPALLATVLLQPGVMGIALALNAGQMLGADYRWLVSAVTLTVAVSEIFAAFLPGDIRGAA
jgi:hypothetical protein